LISESENLLKAGEISGVFGVKGWLKVFSYTDPRENILKYSPWVLLKNNIKTEIPIIGGQRHGNVVIAELQGVTDRDIATGLQGASIFIRRNQLPSTQEGEYYWSDLEGLEVETDTGISLGKVQHLIETGANDVLVVFDGKAERLIPFLQKQTILNIDLKSGKILVDWDPDF
jgi:16S rRNA processing protein RimM